MRLSLPMSTCLPVVLVIATASTLCLATPYPLNAQLTGGSMDRPRTVAQNWISNKSHQELSDSEIEAIMDEASALDEAGRPAEAVAIWKELLVHAEKAYGPDHINVAVSLNNFGNLYDRLGIYSKAQPLLERSLAIRERNLGPDHPTTAIAVNNLAGLYQRQGLYVEAELLYKRSLAIREQALGSSNHSTALALNNLGFLYYTQGLYDKAEPLYRRSLAIKERILEPHHPSIANGLNNLALLYRSKGLYGEAEQLYKRALAIRESSLGLNHPDTAQSLNNLALLYGLQGLYGQAGHFYNRSLEINKGVLGLHHPNTSFTLFNLAALNYELGRSDLAAEFMEQVVSSQADWLIREIPYRPRVQRHALRSTLFDIQHVSFSLTNKTAIGPALALSTRLLHHGLFLEIDQAQASLSRVPSPTQELAHQVAHLNNRISNVGLPPEPRAALRHRRNELEQQLFRLWPDLQIRRIGADQVAAALPADGVLVEFQRYRPWVGGADANKNWGLVRYLALILKPDGSIRSVQLGEAELIEQAIAFALGVSAESLDDAPDLWAKVSDFLLKPLAPHLAGSRQWFFSPDGELHRVPFAALPSSSRPGVPLASAVQLRLITTGRDLVRFQKPVPSGKPPVVLANPNFERGRLAPAVLIAATQSQQRSGDLSNQRWDSLPATAKEGEQVATLLGAKPISGDAATVGVLQRSIGPRILHIASHGFFVGDLDIPPENPLRASLAGGGQVARFQGEDPLLRSGIVLAGANNPGLDPNDDGLLTALEATALQLDGTELVVLSACSTGSGDIQSGEGLYGLQRALTVAGARSTLLSLWKVDDAATAEFMVRFYRRLKAGEGRADALAAVQAEFRAGDVKGSAGEDWSRPYYWAAWQLVGDWRPIEGL